MNPTRLWIRPVHGGYRLLFDDTNRETTIWRSQVIPTLREAKLALELTRTYAPGALVKIERRNAA